MPFSFTVMVQGSPSPRGVKVTSLHLFGSGSWERAAATSGVTGKVTPGSPWRRARLGSHEGQVKLRPTSRSWRAVSWPRAAASASAAGGGPGRASELVPPRPDQVRPGVVGPRDPGPLETGAGGPGVTRGQHETPRVQAGVAQLTLETRGLVLRSGQLLLGQVSRIARH